MRFSIIIPVYNAQKYIKESVSSVLNQTFQDYEIILVNDGSVDQSADICDTYAQRHPDRIRVIHQKNQGQLLTRCNGIQAANGEYCVFLDADDALDPNGLQWIEDAVLQYNNPDMVIYSFLYDRMDGKTEKAKPLFLHDTLFSGEEQKKELYRAFVAGTLLNNVWTKAVKKTVFDGNYPDYRKYAHIRCSEDRLHAMGMVTNADRVVYMNKPVYIYKIIPNSVSRSFTIDTISRFNIKELYEIEMDYFKCWDINTPEIIDRINANWMIQTWYIFDQYYNKVHHKHEKEELIKYNWCEFLPIEVLDGYEKNSVLNHQQKLCWRWIIEKKYGLLRWYMRKKKLYLTVRNCKRRIINKRK